MGCALLWSPPELVTPSWVDMRGSIVCGDPVAAAHAHQCPDCDGKPLREMFPADAARASSAAASPPVSAISRLPLSARCAMCHGAGRAAGAIPFGAAPAWRRSCSAVFLVIGLGFAESAGQLFAGPDWRDRFRSSPASISHFPATVRQSAVLLAVIGVTALLSVLANPAFELRSRLARQLLPCGYRADYRAALYLRDRINPGCSRPGRAIGIQIWLFGRCDGEPMTAHTQNQQRRHEAGKAAGDKCQEVVAIRASYGAGAEGCQSTADLMTGEFQERITGVSRRPKTSLVSAKVAGPVSDPVQAIEDRKDRQADKIKFAERHDDQRNTAQAVVPEQQGARVEAVAQTSPDRAEPIRLNTPSAARTPAPATAAMP